MQFAVKRSGNTPDAAQVFVIEANPRASRTVPFVAKATGVPLVKVASRVMCGATLALLRLEGLLQPPVTGDHISVKEAVLPFNRFPDAGRGARSRDALDRRGHGHRPDVRAGVRQVAARGGRPDADDGECVFMSLADRDKPTGLRAAQRFADLGFEIVATAGTAAFFTEAGVRE